ncbi:MAG TPA: DUF3667 domain-containing protein [Sphingobacteriaceae bacterium]
MTHTDKGILLLIKEMFARPGIVAREYVEGKRKKYFNPITFLLILMAVQVYAVKKTDFYGKFTRTVQKAYESMAKANAASTENVTKFNKQMEKADKQAALATDNNKLLTVIFIPLLALLTWLFFRKSGFNYAENLVFNVLINGQLIVWFLMICIIPVIIKSSLVVLVMYLYILASWVYAIIAYKQFYRQRWGLTIVKGLTLQVIYFLAISFTSSALISFID